MTRRLVMITLALGLSGAFAYYLVIQRDAADTSSPEAVAAFCSACHRFPPPDTLPRFRWRATVESMYTIGGEPAGTRPPAAPPIEASVKFYVDRAPEFLPPSLSTVHVGPGPLEVSRIPLKIKGLPPHAGTANVLFAHLFDDRHLDLIICEMRFGMVLAASPYLNLERMRLLGRVPHPCHAEVVDLDRDGVRDVLVADLGTVTPSDATRGSVVWLRGNKDGSFTTLPLVTGKGRVADAQAADFDGDGDQDVVAAVFGWRKVGEVLFLENRTSDPASPEFVPRVLDPRPGAIHVPVADLDRDGRPDFIALISQHFETVIAFLNRGGGDFEERTIFTAEHPNWGSSGIEVVDLDGDGDLDVLLANGDTLDDIVLKPYHGIEWLENTGGFPFEYHRITSLHGAHRARAADLDGDGDLDIAACVFLPFLRKDTPGVELADSIIWLEQTERGRFTRHSLEGVTCAHPTLDVGDYDADGDPDIAVGNMTMAKEGDAPLEEWGVILRNER